MRAAMLAAAAALLSVGAGGARGETGALLLDDELVPERVTLLSIDGEAVTYLDEAGRRRQVMVRSLLALVPSGGDEGAGGAGEQDAFALPEVAGEGDGSGGADPARARGYVELVDGQRFPGSTIPTAQNVDEIVWDHPAFGHVTLPIGRVRTVDRGLPGPPMPMRADLERLVEDELVLANGDRVRGLIIALGDPVEIESGGEVLALPAERVARAHLANPSEPLSGLIVWLEDGTVARADSVLTLSGDRFSVSLPGGPSADLAMADLRAVAFGASRFVALSSLEPVEQSAVGSRVFAPPIGVSGGSGDDGPVALNAPDLLMPGPMRVEYALPEGARRLAGEAVRPDSAGRWGDLEFVIEVDGVEAHRARVSAEEPGHAFGVDVRGAGRVTLVVEEGAYGPVRDALILRRALLSLDRAE